MHTTITNLIQNYGCVLLFPLVGLESLGIPLPGETAVVSAAAFAATGRLSIYAVVITAASAATVGDNCGYWVGRKSGIALIHRFGRVLHIDESKIGQARAARCKNGLSRSIYRTVAYLGCRSRRCRVHALQGSHVLQRFGRRDLGTLFGLLGYLFGRNLPRLEHYIGQASLALALLVALIISILLGWRWFRSNEIVLAERLSHSRQRLRDLRLMQWMRNRHPQIWAFVIARFSPDEYLGLHLTTGLAFSVAAMWLFAGVTEDVIHHDSLTQFDVTVLEWFHRHNTVMGLRSFQAISFLGSTAFMAALGVGAVLVLARWRQWLPLTVWAAALGGSGLLDELLKVVIRRPRPIYASAYFPGRSFSFPSGHAMASLVAYGMVAYFLARFWAVKRSTRVMLFLGAFALALAIGISRLYLGVHYFSDVIGGYAAGSVWLATCITGLELERVKQELICSQRN